VVARERTAVRSQLILFDHLKSGREQVAVEETRFYQEMKSHINGQLHFIFLFLFFPKSRPAAER
jgi:hypothetical protein